MPIDAQALLDHLGVEQVDVVGYSVGSVVASRLMPLGHARAASYSAEVQEEAS